MRDQCGYSGDQLVNEESKTECEDELKSSILSDVQRIGLLPLIEEFYEHDQESDQQHDQ